MRLLFIFAALFWIIGALFALTDSEGRPAKKSLNELLPAIWIPVQSERPEEAFGRPPFNEGTPPQAGCGPDSLRARLLRARLDERWEVAVSCFSRVNEE